MSKMKELLNRPPTSDVDRPARYVQHPRYVDERLRLEDNEHEVHHAGEVGVVTIKNDSVKLHWLNHSRESLNFTALVERARRGQLPAWVSQIPSLLARIEATFQAERDRGKDSYHRLMRRGDDIVFQDLRRGVENAYEVRRLLEYFARYNRLPGGFENPKVYALLKIPKPTAPRDQEETRA